MNWEREFDGQIAEQLPELLCRKDEPLSRHTSFRIGGPARRMVFPASQEEIVRLSEICRACGAKMLLLGNGTNVLAPDGGLDAVVVKTAERFDAVSCEGNILTACAGLSLSRLAVFAKNRSLSGLAFAHGIPGSLGGGVVMNAGAYGGELKDVLEDVVAYTPEGIVTLQGKDLAMSYRHSVFTDHPDWIVLRARLRLTPGEPEEIKTEMDALMERRKASQPLEYPSAGSTFKRPDGYFAGTLIEQCGLKGLRVGDAEVSVKHAGFVINRGHAACADVTALIEKIRETVLDKTGVRLEPEVRILA